MLKSEFFVIFLMTAVVSTLANHYEESHTYSRNPRCKPSRLAENVKCSNIGPSITVRGGLYTNWELQYMPLASAYYVARLADALGYQECCPSNTTFLKELNIIAPWSGTHGPIAIDGSCGYDRVILRRCTFPTATYPFLCTGSDGIPGTFGKRLDTLSFNSVLQGSNLRWTLFIHCWNAKTPENPNAKETAVSFNVFNLDPVLSPADRAFIIRELNRRGFDTSPNNIIEFDYTKDSCFCKSNKLKLN